MTLSGISQMLRRHGWSHQIPARRAIERDEAAPLPSGPLAECLPLQRPDPALRIPHTPGIPRDHRPSAPTSTRLQSVTTPSRDRREHSLRLVLARELGAWCLQTSSRSGDLSAVDTEWLSHRPISCTGG
ncbi:winged helix-turn-helix domain-containing protein [Streptomyces collinus]|uniref:helix-turn-helix domain-containing protein n=1 Tax=Streptomyces collinus TaxID=42684 RepID=UPI0036EADC0D